MGPGKSYQYDVIIDVDTIAKFTGVDINAWIDVTVGDKPIVPDIED